MLLFWTAIVNLSLYYIYSRSYLDVFEIRTDPWCWFTLIKAPECSDSLPWTSIFIFYAVGLVEEEAEVLLSVFVMPDGYLKSPWFLPRSRDDKRGSGGACVEVLASFWFSKVDFFAFWSFSYSKIFDFLSGFWCPSGSAY